MAVLVVVLALAALDGSIGAQIALGILALWGLGLSVYLIVWGGRIRPQGAGAAGGQWRRFSTSLCSLASARLLR